MGVGSNGFPGYSPQYSGTYDRDMQGVYVDVSADVSESLFLQGAMRFEDYSDFGSELVSKIAFRYVLTDDFNLRGSVGTGFRAPTPGQQGTTNVSTRLPNGLPVATGLFPAISPVGQALGAEALSPEKSLNYALGFTGAIDRLNLTLDLYRIELEDRFYAVSTLDVSTDPTSGDAYDNYLKLDAAGVSGANSIGGVNYFQNAFDTVTQGMDFVATNIQKYGSTVFFDLEAQYQLSESVSLSAGARNIFDEYPDKDSGDDCCGNVYWSSNIVDWQGGYYYARLNYTF